MLFDILFCSSSSSLLFSDFSLCVCVRFTQNAFFFHCYRRIYDLQDRFLLKRKQRVEWICKNCIVCTIFFGRCVFRGRNTILDVVLYNGTSLCHRCTALILCLCAMQCARKAQRFGMLAPLTHPS